MQIEIDFDVFKELTARRRSEADSYNSVIRRLLNLPAANALSALQPISSTENCLAPEMENALAAYANKHSPPANALATALGGAWFDNIHFPEGTQFRATYKGRTYTAEIRDGRWVSSDGVIRTSPSAAAGAISNTNVNGWRFWYFKRPGDSEWMRMDILKP